jgi:hypothetical protein
MSLTIKNQGKLAGIALAAGLAVTAFGTGTALAASPAEDCAAAGGIYTAAGPDSTCTIAGTPVGNSDNTKGGSTDTGPGKSQPNEEVTTCTGVNNQPHPCP